MNQVIDDKTTDLRWKSLYKVGGVAPKAPGPCDKITAGSNLFGSAIMVIVVACLAYRLRNTSLLRNTLLGIAKSISIVRRV